MPDISTALREQIVRCDGWLREHGDDPAISPRATEAVLQLRRRLEVSLKESAQ